VDPIVGLDDLEKRKFFTLPGLELRPVSRPARSQPLYRLRYPDSSINVEVSKITGKVDVINNQYLIK
jgi:hypothetical protein